MKEINLFCFVTMKSTKAQCFSYGMELIIKFSMSTGAATWVGVQILGLECLKLLCGRYWLLNQFCIENFGYSRTVRSGFWLGEPTIFFKKRKMLLPQQNSQLPRYTRKKGRIPPVSDLRSATLDCEGERGGRTQF
jgi:hypothetical protein